MDYTNTDFWIAIAIGGTVVGSFNLLQQVFYKNPEEPYSGIRYRTVFRDFFFGSFLTALLYMLLPESFQNMISAGQTSLQKLSGGSLASFTSSAPQDFEIQTGPARF
jgi:hypothetical protein